MKPRAFLLSHNRRYDTSRVRQYGVPVYLFRSAVGVSPLNTSRFIDVVVKGLKGRGFNPKEDMLVLTGGTLEIALLMFIAANMKHPLRVLMYDARNSNYTLRTLNHDDNQRSALEAVASS